MNPLEILASHLEDLGIYFRPHGGFRMLTFVGFQPDIGHHLDIFFDSDQRITIEEYHLYVGKADSISRLEYYVADPRWLEDIDEFIKWTQLLANYPSSEAQDILVTRGQSRPTSHTQHPRSGLLRTPNPGNGSS